VIPRSELRRLALASLPGTALLLLDADLRVAAAAGAVEECYGCEPEDLLGLHFEGLLAPHSARAGVRGAQLAFDGETRILRVGPRSLPDRVLELRTAPLIDDAGAVAGVVAASRDVTAEPAAALEVERRYQLLVEESTDLVTRQAPDGTCLWVSDSVRQILGRRPSELAGRATEEIIHPADRTALRALLTSLADGGEDVRHTYRLRHRDGRWVWLEMSLRAVREPATATVTEIIGVGRDVTARVEAERALERSNADLGRFATVASHDLAEPLVLIRSAADLLQQEAGDRLTAADRHSLEVISRNARKLQGLVDTLLSYAAVDHTRVEHQPVDMARVVDGALALLEARVTATGAVVRRGPLAQVMGDPRLLGVLVQNLLSNAMKFCDGTPHIVVSCSQVPGGWLLAVADDGIGIPDEQLRRIFGMFERVEGSRYPGHGLGLATAQRIAELHGGTIGVRSQVGAGSTFEVVLPAAPA
jgi:PAS domain S-box-containing protein